MAATVLMPSLHSALSFTRSNASFNLLSLRRPTFSPNFSPLQAKHFGRFNSFDPFLRVDVVPRPCCDFAHFPCSAKMPLPTGTPPNALTCLLRGPFFSFHAPFFFLWSPLEASVSFLPQYLQGFEDPEPSSGLRSGLHFRTSFPRLAGNSPS